MAPAATIKKPKQQRDKGDLAGIILTWLLQVVGVAAAIAFGVFSVLCWVNSETANSQADTANSKAETANAQAVLANAQANTANLIAFAALCEQAVELAHL